MTTIADVQDAVQRLWPAEGAESWDAVGLIAGDPNAEVRRIVLAVDATADTAREAIAAEADLLLVHHPLLLRGVTSVAESTIKGRVLAPLIRAHCGLLAAHTNADVVAEGTSGAIAEILGLDDVQPIVPSNTVIDDRVTEGAVPTGLGRVGTLPAAITLGALARTLAVALPATATGIRAFGEFDRQVRRIAVCGGAGDSLIEHPAVLAADVYITSDLRHHPALDARERYLADQGPALIDTSHWASECLWLPIAQRQLLDLLPDVEVTVSDLRTDPWDFALPQ